MKPCFFVFLALAALSFVGCASAPSGTITLPRVPAWIPPTDARVYNQADLIAAVHKQAPGAWLDTQDVKFVAVSHAWLERALPWSWEVGKATRLGEWTEEVWDCDDIADAFSLASNIAAKNAGVKAQPLLARISVHQMHTFGGVAAGGGHALNAFFSDKPPHYWVLEPQTRTLVPLDAYPNRAAIYRVKVGK